MALTAIRTEAIDLNEVVAAVADDRAGAVATFLGVVRNHAGGLEVHKLEYHAYVTMADKELAAIVAELESENEGIRVACIHRIGDLAVGDVAVACAVSSPHRGASFEACRALIDRVKARVPIWKREHGPEGPYWVGWKDART